MNLCAGALWSWRLRLWLLLFVALVLFMKLLVMLNVLWKVVLQIFPACVSSTFALHLHLVRPPSSLEISIGLIAFLLHFLQLRKLFFDLFALCGLLFRDLFGMSCCCIDKDGVRVAHVVERCSTAVIKCR